MEILEYNTIMDIDCRIYAYKKVRMYDSLITCMTCFRVRPFSNVLFLRDSVRASVQEIYIEQIADKIIKKIPFLHPLAQFSKDKACIDA